MENVNTPPPAMLLADGTPVTQDMKVYNILSRYENEVGHVSVIAESTVIWVNNVNRYFLVRCAKGCETKVKMASGCQYADGIYYGSKQSAEAKWHENRLSTIKAQQEAIARCEATINQLKDAQPRYD